ncbi:YfiR family protein [Acinetobacter rathckeae]|uniref:YfiR family protein n=1 Tax=Acinetobacter rathckeae TaxID=2605272 RepID=UPI0018A2731B|nr:YfiR family protein [Acinetobacter rathckeae]MBF7687708.1 YfiR family protein [Acinetobacter rathckeae]MBF7688069.1 YfiR family protein [Acinetobacter rathckeae]MBF7695922.1 YfiR family protein [Acinetobacter rathckeae]
MNFFQYNKSGVNYIFISCMLFYHLKRLITCIGLSLLSGLATAGYTHNAYTLTLAILSYTKWDSQKPLLCVLENHDIASIFQEEIEYKKTSFNVTSISERDLNNHKCDAIFFSPNISIIQQNNIIKNNFRPFILSFTENNLECEGQVIFCLYKRKDQYTFNVNLDALARSKLHIDPRVLLLAKNMEGI